MKSISNIVEFINLSMVFSECDSDTESEPDSPDPKSDSPVPNDDSPVPKHGAPVPKPESPVPKQDSPVPQRNKSWHLVDGHWERKIPQNPKKPGPYKRIKNWAKKRARGMLK